MDEKEDLMDAFSSLFWTVVILGNSYESLKKKVEELNRKLEFKDREIERMRRLEGQTERNSRLVAMGEMAAKIAHEIRNPLGSIELFTSILHREIKDDNLEKFANHISAGVKNLNHVISNLLTFTSQPKPVFKEFDVHAFLDDILQFGEFLMSKNNIMLIKEYCPSFLLGWGDEELLKQVFLNLIMNAVQSMPDGGILKVKTGLGEKISPHHNAPHRMIPHNVYVEIKIIDTGTGISKDNIKKIFNPFFTTRERGTGLGLAIVHTIVESHNGIIEVESELCRGTVFKILLPLKRKAGTKT
jgi:two-component system sensor histidine kinase FlrB